MATQRIAQTPSLSLGSARKDGHVTANQLRKSNVWADSRSVAPGNVPRNSICEGALGQFAVDLIPLVMSTALKIHMRLPAHVELDDLISSGMLGLLGALRKFDASKRVKVEVYARHRIRGAILDGLRTLDPVTRGARKKSKQVEQVFHDAQFKLGRAPNDEEMAAALGVELRVWHRILGKLGMAGADWLRPLFCIRPDHLCEEDLPDVRQESQFDRCYRREQQEILQCALARLRERDRKIVILYYREGLTMKQIGARLKIDQSRVSQLHSAAILQLRCHVKALTSASNASA